MFVLLLKVLLVARTRLKSRASLEAENKIAEELRGWIRGMSRENPLWGAPRIHGELSMLGFEIAESTVGKFMVRTRRPTLQGWSALTSRGTRPQAGYRVR